MILARFKLVLALVCLFPTIGNASPDWLKDYEFKSYYCLDDVYYFSLYNRTSFSSIWLEQGREWHGISVLDFEAGTNTLSLSFNNQVGKLTLLKSEAPAIDGVRIAKQLDSSEVYEEAVRIAAEYQVQNPGASFLDAPIPSSIRSTLLQFDMKNYDYGNPSKIDTMYLKFKDSVGIERRRLIQEKNRLSGTKVFH